MYAKEFKNWISRKNAVPQIVETIDSFKEYWADAIALINQTDVLALQHGYDMTAMDKDVLITLYGDLLANFGAVFATTQVRNHEEPGRQPSHNSEPTCKHPTLHECRPTAPKQQLSLHSATTHIHLPQQAQWWWLGKWPWFPTTTNHELGR
jgi:hypothetical protein